jgi:hypothetical protein
MLAYAYPDEILRAVEMIDINSEDLSEMPFNSQRT